jgi:2-polyprenyl-3-methyl-5-hydroxy-6-metoxy-1,4-benzoquinol methylase
MQADVSEWSLDLPRMNVVICMDVFEHLHDDELGAMLQSIRKQMSEDGSLIFHTFPTQFDYLFHSSKGRYCIPLTPFRKIKTSAFARLVRAYAAMLDAYWILKTGRDRREMIKKKSHCNPLTRERLVDIALRAGFEIELMELEQLYPEHLFTGNPKAHARFNGHPISYRNLYGVLIPRPAATAAPIPR